MDRWPSLIQTTIPKVLDYPLRSFQHSWFVTFPAFMKAFLGLIFFAAVGSSQADLYASFTPMVGVQVSKVLFLPLELLPNTNSCTKFHTSLYIHTIGKWFFLNTFLVVIYTRFTMPSDLMSFVCLGLLSFIKY